MKVEVRFEAQLRLTAGTGEIMIDAPDESTLHSVVHQVAESLGDSTRQQMLHDDGTLRTSLMYFVNDKPIRARDAGDTPVHDRDIISLLPPIAGG
jgi:molybdopterin converting factor small subunit